MRDTTTTVHGKHHKIDQRVRKTCVRMTPRLIDKFPPIKWEDAVSSKRPDGEIGKHKALKMPRSQGLSVRVRLGAWVGGCECSSVGRAQPCQG